MPERDSLIPELCVSGSSSGLLTRENSKWKRIPQKHRDNAKFMNYTLDKRRIALVCWAPRIKSYTGEPLEGRKSNWCFCEESNKMKSLCYILKVIPVSVWWHSVRYKDTVFCKCFMVFLLLTMCCLDYWVKLSICFKFLTRENN